MWHRQAKIPNAAEELESLAWINLECIKSWLFPLCDYVNTLTCEFERVSDLRLPILKFFIIQNHLIMLVGFVTQNHDFKCGTVADNNKNT